MSERNSPSAPRTHAWWALAGSLAMTFSVAGVSAAFTAPAISSWYATLVKPSFNPPNQIFGPVWTLLYALMSIAAWLAWKTPSTRTRTIGLVCFGIQLGFNFAWSLIFFAYHHMAYALLDILALWVAILATMSFFFRLSRAAGWLLVPYLVWVSFASLLNFMFWLKN